ERAEAERAADRALDLGSRPPERPVRALGQRRCHPVEVELGRIRGYANAGLAAGVLIVRLGHASGQEPTGSFARCRCMAALRDRLTRPWRSTSITTTITSSPTDTTSSTVGTW